MYFYCRTLHLSHNVIQSQHSPSDNKWLTDKATFLCLFSLINMLWLAEQYHRQPRTWRVSGSSELVTFSCIDRKWGLLWGQCIDFLAYQVWECREKSHFLSRRMPCWLSGSQQFYSSCERLWKERKLGLQAIGIVHRLRLNVCLRSETIQCEHELHTIVKVWHLSLGSVLLSFLLYLTWFYLKLYSLNKWGFLCFVLFCFTMTV